VASYERLRVEAKREGNRTVLRLSGELDLDNARLLQSELEGADVENASTVLVDLRELEFMDSTGLRMLLTTHQRLQQRGAELAVTGVSVQVERLFGVTQAGEHLKLVDPPDDAP
jgi:anti-sigma B factor antagonist